MRSLFLRGGYSFPSSPSEFHGLPPSQLRRFCPSAFSLSPFAFYLSVARPPTYPLKALKNRLSIEKVIILWASSKIP
jgi:hypothetical protein